MHFKTADVLTVTSGILLGDVDGIYKVCDYMTGVSNFTHMLPQAADKATPYLLAQHPFLVEASDNIKNIKETGSYNDMLAALIEYEETCGSTLDLVPIPEVDMADYNRAPLSTLAEMMKGRSA